MSEIVSGAEISECEKYRYALWRVWEEYATTVVFIGLNPSTADATLDDPTIRRCVGFAKKWGFGGIYMLNLFAYRATNPKELLSVDDPVGPKNNDTLNDYHTGLTIACWGNHGTLKNRNTEVIKLLGANTIHCLGITKGGHPKHPLYLPKSTEYRLLEVNP